ncbi:glycerophosphodiester phosphodiesterase [Siphonobacter sp. BAB-5385]|nr:glycerophosphodiester phosphodiesterase [Siphonobacter sp. BAB-5385]PMD90811.1 glycerophosphodiester phosphodiesterase [Siphonobacter sp. BAB-5405]
MDTHPENTIPAFQRAIQLGAHMIEFDVQFTRDSALVIIHDETVDRTTNGSGRVADLTLADIRQLDAGVKKGRPHTRIPTLEETLAIMPRNVWLNCHLKGGAEVGRAVARYLVTTDRLHQTFLACSQDAARGARAVHPSILICNSDGRNRTDNQAYARATVDQKAHFIQLLSESSAGRPAALALLKQHGIRINYFYAKTPDQLAGLWQAGADFILVNELETFQDATRQAGIMPWKPQF